MASGAAVMDNGAAGGSGAAASGRPGESEGSCMYRRHFCWLRQPARALRRLRRRKNTTCFYADNLDTLEDLGFLDSARALPGADVEGLRDLRMTLRARFRTEQRSHCNP